MNSNIFEVDGVRYTNVYDWPEELVTAVTKNRYYDEEEAAFDFSASTLIAPTQLVILKQRHPDKLAIEDVSSRMWAFLGSMSHSCLEEAYHAQDNGDGDLVEQRLYMDVLGKTLSGKMDLYSRKREEVRDYKSCKVYKIVRGDYAEWEKQLNVYARLITLNGFPVKRLTVIPLIFDFKAGESYKKGYPDSASGRIELNLWTPEQQQTYIEERVTRLLAAEQLPDEALALQFPCSDKEQWRDLKDYAIMKSGSTRAAAAGFESEAEAAKVFHEKGYSYATHSIVKRMTERTRCFKYCPVRNICAQHRRQCLEEGNPLPADLTPCIF